MITPATPCTCTDSQLAHVGCDCAAEQNVPACCADCGCFVRTAEPCGCVEAEEIFLRAQEEAEARFYDAQYAELIEADAPFVEAREDFAEWTLAAARHQ